MATTRQVILGTGSAGYSARHSSRRLLLTIRLLVSTEAAKGTPTDTDFIECDLTKDESVRDALRTLRGRQGEQGTSHLAAHYFFGEPSPLY